MQDLANKIFFSTIQQLRYEGAIKKTVNLSLVPPKVIEEELMAWTKEFFDYFAWVAKEVHRHHDAPAWIECQHYICLSIRSTFAENGVDPVTAGFSNIVKSV